MFNENVIDVKMDNGVVISLQGLGVSEFYDVLGIVKKTLDPETQAALAKELEPLKDIKDKDLTPEQSKDLIRITDELASVNIQSDKEFRTIMMKKAVSIKKGNEVGTAEDAALYLDRLVADDLVKILNKIQPDLEKNSQSQS